MRAPLPAASSTSAETAAMFSASSAELSASCSAATVISDMGLGSVFSGLLAEQQRHAVALADGGIALAVLVAETVVRRQGPDAGGIVGGIVGVGVDLALRDEREAAALDHRDHVLLPQVALAAVD